MITLKRLNMDSSWHIKMPGAAFILDPWLVGSEVDGFSWLNEQWHITEPVGVADVDDHDFIVISQSYEDHCHLQTLEQLDASKPILATSKAYKRLKKKFPQRAIHLIPEKNGSLRWEGLEFMSFRPKKLVDPIYFAMSITTSENQCIFYAPHGFTLSRCSTDSS